MNKLILLSAVFAIALAAPEPPVSGFENTMEGLTLDPELLKMVAEILAGTGGSGGGSSRGAGGSRSSGNRGGSQSYSAPQSSYSAPQSSYSSPPQSYQSGGTQGGRSAGGAAGGSSNFEIDEIQPAPLVADFDFEAAGDNGARAGAGGRGYIAPQSGGYSAPQSGGYSVPQSGGYSAPQAPSRNYGPPSAGGYN